MPGYEEEGGHAQSAHVDSRRRSLGKDDVG